MSSAEKQNFPDKFRSPQRRLTRQRSGHNVSGEGTGSTCKIEQTRRVEPVKGQIKIEVPLAQTTAPALFLKKLGIFGTGILFPAIIGVQMHRNIFLGNWR